MPQFRRSECVFRSLRASDGGTFRAHPSATLRTHVIADSLRFPRSEKTFPGGRSSKFDRLPAFSAVTFLSFGKVPASRAATEHSKQLLRQWQQQLQRQQKQQQPQHPLPNTPDASKMFLEQVPCIVSKKTRKKIGVSFGKSAGNILTCQSEGRCLFNERRHHFSNESVFTS